MNHCWVINLLVLISILLPGLVWSLKSYNSNRYASKRPLHDSASYRYRPTTTNHGYFSSGYGSPRLSVYQSVNSLAHGSVNQDYRYGYITTNYRNYEYDNLCKCEMLTCVKKKDCGMRLSDGGHTDGHLCPPFFEFDTDLAYCTSVSIMNMNNLEAVKLCKSQGARLLHIENTAEFKLLVKERVAKGKDFFLGDGMYWLDAYYSDKSKKWISRTKEEPIHWDLIFPVSFGDQAEPKNKDVVAQIDPTKRCLVVQYEDKHPEKLKVSRESCSATKQVLCKLGHYKNKCQENKRFTCCFIPSYDHYRKYNYEAVIDKPHPRISGLGSSYRNCFIEIQRIQSGGKAESVPCKEALLMLNPVTTPDMQLKLPYRIGSSYFYLSDEDCIGKNKRRAVISSRKIHRFISRLMVMANARSANSLTSLIIGLSYNDNINKAIWENGEPHDYYEETFWNGGQANFNGYDDIKDPVCVRYVVSPDKFQYRWELIKTCTAAGTDLQMCELPIKVTGLTPQASVANCGRRLRRGVLGRAFYHSAGDYSALYGEFPWHAAIYKVHHHFRELVTTFLCSGVLIHEKFVLTTAHCLTGSAKAITVVLGEYKLGGSNGILRRVVTGVQSIITHPDYEAANPIFYDIALLQVEKVPVTSFPHVNLVCLLDSDILYMNTRAWDCYTVGWQGKSGFLKRIEANIASRRLCHIYSHAFSNSASAKNPHKYYWSHGYHLLEYLFSPQNPEMICTDSNDGRNCVDDPAAVLVCRQIDSRMYDWSFHEDEQGQGYIKLSKSKIINAYGKGRFDRDKWYLLGLSNTLSPCRGSSSKEYIQGRMTLSDIMQVFTPVHEYLSFIHSHLDRFQTRSFEESASATMQGTPKPPPIVPHN